MQNLSPNTIPPSSNFTYPSPPTFYIYFFGIVRGQVDAFQIKIEQLKKGNLLWNLELTNKTYPAAYVCRITSGNTIGPYSGLLFTPFGSPYDTIELNISNIISQQFPMGFGKVNLLTRNIFNVVDSSFILPIKRVYHQ